MWANKQQFNSLISDPDQLCSCGLNMRGHKRENCAKGRMAHRINQCSLISFVYCRMHSFKNAHQAGHTAGRSNTIWIFFFIFFTSCMFDATWRLHQRRENLDSILAHHYEIKKKIGLILLVLVGAQLWNLHLLRNLKPD